MLQRTFIHIPTVGEKKEIMLWQKGIETWQDFLQKGEKLLPPSLWAYGRPVVEESLAALESPDGLKELAALIPQKEHWRFYPSYERVAYLDIETGGDPDDWGGITVVGVYDGRDVMQYVAGSNLSEAMHCLAGYDMVVTFSGSSFDLPVLRSVFQSFKEPPLHVDLRWLLRRLGYRGGLKRIEHQLGLNRSEDVDGMDGAGAIELWHAWLAGDKDAYCLLLQYNAYDILNLEPLLKGAVKLMRGRMLGRIDPGQGPNIQEEFSWS